MLFLDCFLVVIQHNTAKVCSLETARSGEVFFGVLEPATNGSIAVVYKCRVEPYFPIVAEFRPGFSRPVNSLSRVRRIPGTDNFVVSCDQHLAVISEKTKRVWILENIHETPIADFIILKDNIFSIPVGVGYLVLTKIDETQKDLFSQDINLMASANTTNENLSTIRSKVEISPFSNSRSQSPTPRGNLNPDIYPKVAEFTVSGLNTSRSTTPEKPDKSLASSTLIHQSSPFDNLAAFKYMVPGGQPIEKVSSNKKFTRIYVGSQKVVCLSDDSNPSGMITPQTFENKLIPKDIWNQSLFGLKVTPSGMLIIQENGSNDMVVVDKTGKEVARYKSMSKFVFSRSS